LEEDTELLIGPAPPAIVAEERFEEVLDFTCNAIFIVF
jgi:hypothetical protein